jgi:hypothetical protein
MFRCRSYDGSVSGAMHTEDTMLCSLMACWPHLCNRAQGDSGRHSLLLPGAPCYTDG